MVQMDHQDPSGLKEHQSAGSEVVEMDHPGSLEFKWNI
jgi:hypothetical protein